jgi:hypothetical protein
MSPAKRPFNRTDFTLDNSAARPKPRSNEGPTAKKTAAVFGDSQCNHK